MAGYDSASSRSSWTTIDFKDETPQISPSPLAAKGHLRTGVAQQPTVMPSPGIMSDKASFSESPPLSPIIQVRYHEPPTPMIPDFPADPWELLVPMTYRVPPTPIRPDFPGDVFEKRPPPLPTPTTPTFPSDVFEQGYSSDEEDGASSRYQPSGPHSKPSQPDPYRRPTHNAYPHVFEPKGQPRPKPETKQAESSHIFDTVSNVVKGFVKTATSFVAQRHRLNKKKSGLGMSMPLADSFHDFHAKSSREGNRLYNDIRAIPIDHAQKKSAGNPGPGSGNDTQPKSRLVKVVGHPDRETMWEDFMASDLFSDSSSFKSAKMPPRSPLRNRGSSKDLPPLLREARAVTKATSSRKSRPWNPPTGSNPRPDKRVDTTRHAWMPDVNTQQGEEYDIDKIRAKCVYEQPSLSTLTSSAGASHNSSSRPKGKQPTVETAGLDLDPSSPVDWSEIHRGEFPSNRRVLLDNQSEFNVAPPRFDDEWPLVDNLFKDITHGELVSARRKAYLDALRWRDSATFLSNCYKNMDAEVDQLFDNIDDAVNKLDKPELYDMNDHLERERRPSDGSIVIDTFAHNGHTSWRATERPDEYTVHRDRQRFTADFHETGHGQDDAGLLMERLERQMRGG